MPQQKRNLKLSYGYHKKKEIKQYLVSTGGFFKTRWCGHIRDLKVHKENGTNCRNIFGNQKTIILITTLTETYCITSEK